MLDWVLIQREKVCVCEWKRERMQYFWHQYNILNKLFLNKGKKIWMRCLFNIAILQTLQ